MASQPETAPTNTPSVEVAPPAVEVWPPVLDKEKVPLDYYAILHLPQDASQQDVKLAYRLQQGAANDLKWDGNTAYLEVQPPHCCLSTDVKTDRSRLTKHTPS